MKPLRMKNIVACLVFLSLFTATFVGVPQRSSAAPASINSDCIAGTESSPACNASSANPISGTGGILAKVTHLVAILTGIAAIIMVIIGGLMYVLSNGDTSRVNTARNTLLYAAIGIVITIIAQSIVIFVLNKT